jgi:hypothetical protein
MWLFGTESAHFHGSLQANEPQGPSREFENFPEFLFNFFPNSALPRRDTSSRKPLHLNLTAPCTTMSLTGFPTELDERIIKYLPTPDRTNIVLVSKYYQRIGETLLYKSIRFLGHRDARIKRLLTTLLRRKHLRRLVKSFELSLDQDEPLFLDEGPPLDDDTHYPPSPVQGLICELLWSEIVEIKKMLENLTSRYNISPELRSTWFAKVFEPYPSYDGALALLLCLITQVTTIVLEVSPHRPLVLTQVALLSHDWDDTEEEKLDSPFNKLEVLHVVDDGPGGDVSVTIRPSVKELVLAQKRVRALSVPPNVSKVACALQTLHFIGVEFDPQVLETAIKSSFLANLKYLFVYGLGMGRDDGLPPSTWANFNYRHLKYAMQVYLPRLEEFYWQGMPSYPLDGIVPFGSFSQFPQLKILQLDYNFFLGGTAVEYEQVDLPDVETLLSYLPPQIELLELEPVGWPVIQRVCSESVEEGNLAHFKALYNFQNSADQVSPKKTIRLIVDMQDWPHDHVYFATRDFAIDELAIRLFRFLADGFEPLGIKLHLKYSMGPCEYGNACRTLVKPGFTAQTIFYDEYAEFMKLVEDGTKTPETVKIVLDDEELANLDTSL